MSNAVNGAYTEGRYNAVLNDDDSLASLPPLVALQFLGFAFSEQGENSLRVTNERLNRIRQDLDEVNEAIAIIQSYTGDSDDEDSMIEGDDYEFVTAVLDEYGIDYSGQNNTGTNTLTFSNSTGNTWVDQLQTESTSLSNDLQRLITQAQSEGSRIEQGNSFGESARQTSDTVVDVLLGRA